MKIFQCFLINIYFVVYKYLFIIYAFICKEYGGFMKKQLFPLLVSLMMLASCGSNNLTSDVHSTPEVSDEESKATVRPNVYEQLSMALEDLTQSMTLTGVLSHATSDGTNTSEEQFETRVEISADAYYYVESDTLTGEHYVEENYFEDSEGYAVTRSINMMTNTVDETRSSQKYADVMESPMSELSVKDIKGIREKPNWYVLNNNTLASRILFYLTGYQTTGLPSYTPTYNYYETDTTPTVSEFAIHFNGDQIDQLRVIFTSEISEDDGYYYYDGYLFELDVSLLGETIPSSIEPYEHTDNHTKLYNALHPYAWDNQDARNYTMHVDATYANNTLDPFSYDTYIDFDKGIIYSDRVFVGAKAASSDDEETEYYNYTLAYQFETDETTNESHTYMYRYTADDNHDFIRKDEVCKYWGISDSSFGEVFSDVAPMINALAPECFFDNGDNTFTPRTTLKSTAIRSLLTFEEYINQPTSGDFKVVITQDGKLDYLSNSLSGNYYVDSTTTVYTTLTYKTTYGSVGTTTIPSFVTYHE